MSQADTNDKHDVSFLDEGVVGTSEADDVSDPSKLPGEFNPALPLALIVPNDWNPNTQDDKEFDMLCRRMSEVGMVNPIQVVPTTDKQGNDNYTILGGEHRWKAAKALGWKTIPALILTHERFQSDDLRKFVTMQMNIIHGKDDGTKFHKMYTDLATRYEPDKIAELMGFTKMHAFKLLSKGVAEGLPTEMKKEFNEKAKKAKDPDALQGILSELIGKYGNDLDYNFMIFTHEGKEHIWMRMDDAVSDRITKVLNLCRTRAVDINSILVPAFDSALEAFDP